MKKETSTTASRAIFYKRATWEMMDAYIRRTFRRAELSGDVPQALLQRWRSELEVAGLLGVSA